MTQITLHEGDNRDHLRRLIAEGVRVHSVVTDPPYGLVSVTKRFGKDGAAPAKFGTDGAFQRASAGFMGSKWDGTGIERDPEFWKLIYDILLPGGYVLAFSSPRTGHWQACAMEMAGFVMHPFLGWVYGQGFPKDHDAAMAIDKALGKPGHKAPVGEPVRRIRPGADQNKDVSWEKLEDRFYQPGAYVPGTPEGEQWLGWAYGGQTLKPALEPIYVGQKPFSEKSGALNLLKHGVGALNIDGCRVETEEGGRAARSTASSASGLTGTGGAVTYGEFAVRGSIAVGTTDQGRHPANIAHDGSPEVVAMFPQSHGQQGDLKGHASKRQSPNGIFGEMGPAVDHVKRGDSGSAARFFNAFPLDVEPICYQGKASTADRMAQCLICERRFVGQKPDCGCKDENGKAKTRGHPTVKPIALMRWLCRLVTPPGGVVLDPFAGSGTTGEAARAEGFDCILMEAEETFAADIRFRFDLTASTGFDFNDLLGLEPADDPLDALLG